MATPNGLPTTVWFQWGTNTLYGNQTPPVSVGAGYNVVYTTNQINGLVANVPYHFRLVASNAVGVVYGFDQILDEANVVVWGYNFLGQLNVPPGLSNVVAIAGAYDHSLALKNNGTAVSWGDNIHSASLVVPAGLNNLVAVAGGESYSLALKNSGTVVAWGVNTFPGETNVPAGLNNVVTIASGTYSSLALKDNGTVVAWGPNIFGLTNVPAGLSNAVAIAGGDLHSLAIKNDGTVVAWGDDSSGQADVPANLTNVVAISAGNSHSLALKYDGTVVAWGDNSDGQTDVPVGLNNVVAIAAGGYNSMALKSDGAVVAWGFNSFGQTSVPVGLTNAVAIAGGNLHSLALTPQSVSSLINPVVLDITNGVPQTNGIFAGGIIYYRVNVPTNADFATNSLLYTLNGPLNVWFTTNSPPTIAVNASLLLAGVTNGSSILSTNSMPTNIVPGSTYYLGVQNTNSIPVTYGIEVDFHLVTSTNPPPQTNTIPISSIIYTNGGYLLIWFAPSNDLFQVQFTDSLVPANWQSFSNIISYNTNAFTNPTNTQFNFFDDGVEYPFTGLRFYQLILLGVGSSPTNPPPVIVTLTNGIPYAGNNAATGNATDYYLYTVSTNAARVQFEVDAPSGDVTLVAIKELPLPSLVTYDYISTNAYTNTELIVFFTNSVPVALTPGDWYLAVVNVSGGPVTYSVKATEWSVTGRPITTTGVNISSTNFCITWNSLPGVYYHVQGLVNLASTNWVTVSPTILAVTNTTTYCAALPSPYNFFRVVEGMVVNVNAPNTPPVFVSTPSNRFITPLYTLAVTNNATDAQAPPQTLAYTLPVAPTNAVINPASGVITWTPTLAQTSTTNTFTTVVTDNGTPGLSATNSFTVVVIPPITISGFVVLTNGYQFQWSAPTNLQFQVQWKTNLLPVINWNTFTNILSSISGIFTFTDDGSQSGGLGGMKFYRLIEYP
jgi:alpha-tubulin suppressor-like RCC1 family protein